MTRREILQLVAMGYLAIGCVFAIVALRAQREKIERYPGLAELRGWRRTLVRDTALVLVFWPAVPAVLVWDWGSSLLVVLRAPRRIDAPTLLPFRRLSRRRKLKTLKPASKR